MPGGCWICNPMCGRCRPPAYKSATCPDCNTLNMFDKKSVIAQTGIVCKKCKRDLTEEVVPKVVRCKYSGLICAYPCGNSTNPKEEFGDYRCEMNTRPSPEWIEAHPKAKEFIRQ